MARVAALGCDLAVLARCELSLAQVLRARDRMAARRRRHPAIAIVLARHRVEPRHHAAFGGSWAIAARADVDAGARADSFGDTTGVGDTLARGAIDLAAAQLAGARRLRQRIGQGRATARETDACARRLRRLVAHRVTARFDAARREARVVPAAFRVGRTRDDRVVIAAQLQRWRWRWRWRRLRRRRWRRWRFRCRRRCRLDLRRGRRCGRVFRRGTRARHREHQNKRSRADHEASVSQIRTPRSPTGRARRTRRAGTSRRRCPSPASPARSPRACRTYT